MTYECPSPAIFHGLCCEFMAGPLDSEPYRSPGQCFHPCGHFAVCRCPAWRLSTVPVSLNFLSNLLMLLFVHPLSGNSFLNCLALYLFKWYNFLLESYFRRWHPNHVYKQCSNVWRLGWRNKWLLYYTRKITRTINSLRIILYENISPEI